MQELHAFTTQNTIKMYATTWCGDCRMAKRWFEAHGIPYEYIDIERDERAAAEVLRLNGGLRSVPTIVFPDGSILVEPSARQLAAQCLQAPEPSLGKRLKNLYEGILKRELKKVGQSRRNEYPALAMGKLGRFAQISRSLLRLRERWPRRHSRGRCD